VGTFAAAIRSQPGIGRPRISTTSAPVVPVSVSDSAGSTRTITPPLPLAATAMWPPMRKATPQILLGQARLAGCQRAYAIGKALVVGHRAREGTLDRFRDDSSTPLACAACFLGCAAVLAAQLHQH
jgi:hypothetical protein